MNMRWSLKELYPSFESQEFKADMDKLYKKIDEFKEWTDLSFNSKENAVEKAEEYIRRLSEFATLF